MFDGFVFELRHRRGFNHGARSSVVPLLAAQHVERLLHGVFERGRPDLGLELRRLDALVPQQGANLFQIVVGVPAKRFHEDLTVGAAHLEVGINPPNAPTTDIVSTYNPRRPRRCLTLRASPARLGPLLARQGADRPVLREGPAHEVPSVPSP